MRKFSIIGWGVLAVGALHSEPALASRVHFDAFLGLGGGYSELPSDSTKPLVGLTTVGATLGIRLLKSQSLFVGVMSDYRFITQYNSTPASVGNRRGSYFNPLSPVVGLVYKALFFKMEPIFLGTYDLANPTISGQSVAFSSPLGLRVEVRLQGKRWGFGVFCEYVSFGRRQLDSVASSLPDKLSLLQGGVVLAFKISKTDGKR